MYVLTKIVDNTTVYFSMLATNGVFTNEDIRKAIIFSTSQLATKQKEVILGFDDTNVFVIKQITLTNVS